ncbi:hypothetical protein JIN77_11840 [Verrucomicrobiaceae bacterium R5-34]|nr:hypothetical protein [Verrucomicrobiaceae bacterium R5-34]
MKKPIFIIAASAMGLFASQGAITSSLDNAKVLTIEAKTSENFNQTFTDSNGVSVTLNFQFTASESPNTLGNPSFDIQAVTGSGRLGIDSINGNDTGASANTSFEENEVFTLTVSYVSATGLPVGKTLQAVNFNFNNIDTYRAGSSNGSVTYDWDSNARSATQSQTTSSGASGAIAGLSDDQTFDLLTGDYTGTLSISAQTGSNLSGMRIGTDGFDVALDTIAASSGSTHYDVYILAGQSNGNGRGWAADFGTGTSHPQFEFYKTAQSDVRFYYHKTQTATNQVLPENEWIDLAPGSGHGTVSPENSPEMGPEVSFGDAMADEYPGENIAILKYCHGGTNLHTNWSASGDRYASLLATVAAATTALRDAGHTYTLRGFLWQQGEADCTSTTHANNYEANLTSLVNRVRADIFGGLSRPFVIGKLSDNQSSITGNAGFATVRGAQDNVAANLPNVTTVNTDDDAKFPMRGDAIHFTGVGQVELGLGHFQAMKTLLTNDSDQDGLLDTEEATLGTDPNNADSDHDGSEDGTEIAMGTAPLDGNSFFKVSSIVAEEEGDYTLEWPAKSGATYIVESSTTLEPGSWIEVAQVTADSAVGSWTGQSVFSETIAFYGAEGATGGDFDTASYDSVDAEPDTQASRLSQGGGLTGGGANLRIINNGIFSPSSSGNNGFNLAGCTEASRQAAITAGDYFSFTISGTGQEITYDQLVFYANQFESTAKVDITYRIGTGAEQDALVDYSPAAGNVNVTEVTVDLPDFTTSEDVTFTYYLYLSAEESHGIRFDDIAVRASPSTADDGKLFFRIRHSN